jgi:hypothetical protein
MPTHSFVIVIPLFKIILPIRITQTSTSLPKPHATLHFPSPSIFRCIRMIADEAHDYEDGSNIIV